MIKVLLIDDEETVTNGLKKFVSWESLGIDKVMTAESADVALKLVENEKPDIIISDIRMPRMNGIELCQVIRDHHMPCRIVFLSGYADKEYLKGAIQLSAEEYIEKPVNIQVMEECLQKVVIKCEKDKEMQRKELELDRYRNSENLALHEEFVRAAVSGTWNESRSISGSLADTLPIGSNEEMLLIVLQLKKEEGYGKERMDSVLEEVKAQLRKTKFLTYRKSDRLLILLAHFTKSEYMTAVSEEIMVFADKINQAVLKIPVFGVFSSRMKSLDAVPQAYQNSAALLQKVYFYGYPCAVKQEKEEPPETDFENADLSRFRQAVWKSDYEEIKEAADAIFAYLSMQVNVLPNTIKNIFFHMIYAIYEKAEKVRNPEQKQVWEEQNYLWEKIHELETINECYEYLLENIDMLCNNTAVFVTDNKTVLSIMAYVKKNFMNEEMSIKQIADSVFMSPTYMTTFFKKKTGRTIGQYIKDVRMEYASFLLTEKNYTVSEIAAVCGYSDANYFTKVFRKEYGMSPSKYKERL